PCERIYSFPGFSGGTPAWRSLRVAEPVPRPRPAPRRAVARIGQLAALEREAAATDALGEAGLQALELGEPFLDARRPLARQAGPVAPPRHVVRRQPGELGADLVQRQPDLLGEDDEGDAPQHRAWIPAMARAGALRADESLLLIETQRRGGDPAAPRHLADGEQIVHGESLTRPPLDFKLT